MIMRRILVPLAVLLVVASAGAVRAEKKPDRIVAVIHPSNPTTELADAEVKNIYLGRRKTWSDGTPIRPFMRPHNHPSGFEMLKAILKMTPARFKHHWQSLELSGQGTTPKTLHGASDVAEKVSGLKGGIGYVTETEAKGLPAQVKVVKIKY
jgi:ABC-type phosphate transport system substrate-binding protein